MTTVADIPAGAIGIKFVRSGGPGGQHVNKVATAVQLRVDLTRAHLPPGTERRLRELASHLVTDRGELVIFADRYRSQARNRQDAEERLDRLLAQAGRVPKRRVATRVSRAVKRRRLDTKKRRGDTKRLRGKPNLDR